jgi:5'-methylthioadenosine phosphorylase
LGAAVIGMTNLQEAKLAREAELCFATIALSTDYDCWHQSEEEVSVEAVLKIMSANIENSKKILKDIIQNFNPENSHCSCQSSLQYAVLTDKKMIPATTKEKLDLLVGKYL